MLDAQRRLARREQVIFQQVDGKQVLLNLADGQYYALDEVGSRIWSLCDGTRVVADVVAVLCDEFDAAPATIESDARELLADLLDAQLVVDTQ
jgi:coenzyme PQQ synthesis protein D (PqqD)